jgi:hypothetical protein
VVCLYASKFVNMIPYQTETVLNEGEAHVDSSYGHIQPRTIITFISHALDASDVQLSQQSTDYILLFVINCRYQACRAVRKQRQEQHFCWKLLHGQVGYLLGCNIHPE